MKRKTSPREKHKLDSTRTIWNHQPVRRPFSFLALALLAAFGSPFLRAQETPASSTEATPVAVEPVAPPQNRATALSLRDAIVLGLVEGISEFLPISSTGHLIVANNALGLEGNLPLNDASGQPLWYKKPSAKRPAGVPLTLTLAANTYTVVIQVGAIAAVVLIYWAQLVGILRGLLGKNAAGLRLLRNIVLAFLPCAVLGFTLSDWLDSLFSIKAVVVALISGAVLMFAAERWRRNQPTSSSLRREPADLTAKQSLAIGLMQCLALWPGTSRSMVTMVGGYFAGLSPARAAEFSFLVGLPTLTGAALYKGYKSGPPMIELFGWLPVLTGAAVAALSAALAVKFLVSYLTRHGLGVFAIYRLLLAAALTAWFLV